MSIFDMVIMSIGLAMDSFAASICKGLSIKRMKIKYAIIIGIYFGIFQALMPLIGYGIGNSFVDKISNIDHWIIFFTLFLLGINMITSTSNKEKEINNYYFSHKEMILLAIATSIDALAVGISLALLNVNIIIAVFIIGIITFILTFIGTYIGNIFGNKYEKRSQLVGGLILIFIGIKILIEHLHL